MAHSNNQSNNKTITETAPTDIIDAIKTAPNPVVNTRYLANELGTSLEEMDAELCLLADEGVLGRMRVGSRVDLWWLSLDTELDYSLD